MLHVSSTSSKTQSIGADGWQIGVYQSIVASPCSRGAAPVCTVTFPGSLLAVSQIFPGPRWSTTELPCGTILLAKGNIPEDRAKLSCSRTIWPAEG